MKRLMILFILVVMALSLFAGCQSPNVDAAEPSKPIDPNVLFTEPPTQGTLKETYDNLVNYVISDRYPLSTWYYGAINDCIVVFMEGNTFWTQTIVVADCEFYHTQGFNIFVYKGGERCKLEEAYEKGWLTKEHIKQLEVRHLEVVKALREWELG